MENQRSFGLGTDVEARREEPGLEGFWYSAKILDVQPEQDRVYLQYDTFISRADEPQPLKEFVKLSNVRPRPPDDDYLIFEPGDRVDALCGDGWLEGTIKEAVGDGESEKFIVFFSSLQVEVEFEIKNLRHSANSIERKWTPKKSQILLRSPVIKFRKGMLVEVRGISDAWFTATIIDAAGDNSFVVEYQHLKTDDGSELLKVIEDSEHIRPFPRPLPVTTFSLHDKVNAWHKDGWRAGVVSGVLEDPKYIVSFPNTNEETEFEPCYVRLHQEWINGKWIKGGQIYSGVASFFPPRVHDNVCGILERMCDGYPNFQLQLVLNYHGYHCVGMNQKRPRLHQINLWL